MRSADCLMNKSAILSLLCVGLSLGFMQKGFADAKSEAAAKAVGKLHQTLVDVMKLKSASKMSDRLKKMNPVVEEVFDVEWISKYAITPAEWDKLSPEQQRQFVSALTNYMVSSYATRFGDFKGESFRTVQHGIRKSSAVVLTEFKTAKGKTKKFVYQLKPKKNKWVILNVSVDGVSDIALKRAEYGGILKKEGIDSLIGKLTQKTKEQLNQNAK